MSTEHHSVRLIAYRETDRIGRLAEALVDADKFLKRLRATYSVADYVEELLDHKGRLSIKWRSSGHQAIEVFIALCFAWDKQSEWDVAVVWDMEADELANRHDIVPMENPFDGFTTDAQIAKRLKDYQ